MSPNPIDTIKVDFVLDDVFDERGRQDARWGEQNHPDGTGSQYFRDRLETFREGEVIRVEMGEPETWINILGEEVAEAFAESDPARLRAELIQVAAVACAWVEAIDRRGSHGDVQAV